MKRSLILATLSLVAGSLCAQVTGPPMKPGYPRPSIPSGAPFRGSNPAGAVIRPPAMMTPATQTLVRRSPATTLTQPLNQTAPKIVPPTPARGTDHGVGLELPAIRTHVLPAPPPGTAIRPAVVNPPGLVGGPGASIRLNPRTICGPLSIPPRRMPPTVGVAPGVIVVREVVPIEFGRYYDGDHSVVVVSAEDGQKTELPYSAMPLLFAPGTANLLDQSAADILESLGSTLLELHGQDENVRFVIEGHTSTDHEAPDALELSTHRASRVRSELITRYHVPAAILSSKGFGDTYADYRDGTEEQMQLDRRVLVVRTQ